MKLNFRTTSLRMHSWLRINRGVALGSAKLCLKIYPCKWLDLGMSINIYNGVNKTDLPLFGLDSGRPLIVVLVDFNIISRKELGRGEDKLGISQKNLPVNLDYCLTNPRKLRAL